MVYPAAALARGVSGKLGAGANASYLWWGGFGRVSFDCLLHGGDGKSFVPLSLLVRKSSMKPAPPRSGWTLQRCESFDDMRVQAIRRWQRVSATARATAAWELVVEAWSLKKRPAHELRLQRVITVMRKG